MATYPLSLAALKINLGRKNPDEELSAYLSDKLSAAAEELAAAGITIDENIAKDRELLVVYAAHLYRAAVSGEAKPMHLINLMNNAKTRQRT